MTVSYPNHTVPGQTSQKQFTSTWPTFFHHYLTIALLESLCTFTLQTGRAYIEVILLQQGMQDVQFNQLNRTFGKGIQVGII